MIFFFKQPPKPNRILVTGVGKTGSTALFHAILHALPPDTKSLFEPESREETLPENIAEPVLVKSFIPYSENFNFFEKKILLVRDPRDQLISELLYRPFRVLLGDPDENHDKIIDTFLDLVRRKEASPNSVSFRELFDTLPVGVPARLNYMLNYKAGHPEALSFKYEDFVDQKLKKLNRFLGFKIEGAVQVPGKYERVIRTKTYGNWRNWFTPEDVDHFRPIMKEFMKKFGYRDDWKLNMDQRIDPKTGTQYVEKIIAEARQKRKQ